jgi:hypothetical protein
VSDPYVKPLRIESDAPGRTPVGLRQVVRDSDGNVVKDEIVRLVYFVEDGPAGPADKSATPR